MSSDYEYSDDDGDYYDEDELMDQDDQGQCCLTPLQSQCAVVDYSADSAPSEEEMDIDAFEVPVKGKQKSYHVDFSPLSQSDVERAMGENIEYITGIFGLEVCTLHGRSGISNQYYSARSGFAPPAALRVEQGETH